MHCYYQDYLLNDPRLDPLYAALVDTGIILVIHAGYDIAYPRVRKADPGRIRAVCRRFPGLKLVATHLGGWDEWEEVETLLVGEPVWMELSFALDHLAPERVRRMLLAHPADRLLFGTDSPWTDQAASLERLRGLNLPADLYARITGANARRLLDD